jgi:hypothetical protein
VTKATPTGSTAPWSHLPYKDALCRHLQKRYGELFGATLDFLFYDVTSTYFEGTAAGNPQATAETIVPTTLRCV